MSQQGSGSQVADGGGPAPPPLRRVRKQQPQKTIEDFWESFITKYPGKVHTILPSNVYAKNKAAREPKGIVHSQGALQGYEEARVECEEAVRQISKECRRVNMRYRDPHFDIDFDLKTDSRRCLDSIAGVSADSPAPRAVKRVPEIFKQPQFYIDGAQAADVRQGKTGDCYLLAAVGALGNKVGLIDKCCVAKDELVGVYGFIFFRDGEWIHTVIDDKLYLSIPDYDESRSERDNWSEIMNRSDAEQEYKEAFQTGSRALYFAQCNDENETWLPLLEKAYAKAHGDYFSIIGGFTGEAIEDLTGGVTTELFATDILDKNKFWDEELKHVGKQFLFGCATGLFDGWQGGDQNPYRQGIVSSHAYTILRADVYKDERLLLVRNPWGEAEWNGRWSDGSEQWTPESMQALNHRFGNDGMFWISYDDLLRKYQFFDRTRLFDESWTVSQQWTSVDVEWTADYNDTKFTLTLTEATPVVIVLSQLDSRYWVGLEGQYSFSLHFRLDKDGEEGYVVRSHGNYWMSRSVSTEVDLEAGTYSVFIKVKAERDMSAPRVEDVVRRNCKTKQDKLMSVGLSYDLAHAKGMIKETEEAKREKSEAAARAKAKEKQEALKKARDTKYREWQIRKRELERKRREKARLEEHNRKKAAAAANSAPSENKEQEPATTAGNLEVSAGSDKLQVPSPPMSPQPEADTSIASAADTSSTSAAEPTPSSSSASGPESLTEAAEKSTEATDKPAEASETIPVVKVTPPPSPQVAPSVMNAGAAEDEDLQSVASWNSSVDSLLDLPSVYGDDNASVANSSQAGGESDADSDNDEFSADPWNAVCVVGLRVYSKHGDVSLGLVNPKNKVEGETPLDVDDPSKGASQEGTGPQHEKEVLAERALEQVREEKETPTQTEDAKKDTAAS